MGSVYHCMCCLWSVVIGQLEENDFVNAVMNLPPDPVNEILNFHILPENMRENVHRSLPEVGNILPCEEIVKVCVVQSLYHKVLS